MKQTYFDQLLLMYPEKAEVLKWLHVKLDRNVYLYSPTNLYPQNKIPTDSLKVRIIKQVKKIIKPHVDYEHAVICEAYFNIDKCLRDKGFKVTSSPWSNGHLSKEGLETMSELSMSSSTLFNELISDEFIERVYKLKNELKTFLVKNHTPMVLLANGEQPIYRMVIDLCKELNIPTGVYLHGLPGRYSLDDNYTPDYLFVWGEKIKENFMNIGCKSKIVVTGHPVFSQYKSSHVASQNIVVLTQATSYPHCAGDYVLEDDGITIHYIYAVEQALKAIGYTKAILRPHPGEDPNWYIDRMDKDFYIIDTKPLKETINEAEFLIGPISTVILDALYSNVPYYVHIIDSSVNHDTAPVVPPFSNNETTPVSHTAEGLLYNIKNSKSVRIENLAGYVKEEFDMSKIVDIINNNLIKQNYEEDNCNHTS